MCGSDYKGHLKAADCSEPIGFIKSYILYTDHTSTSSWITLREKEGQKKCLSLKHKIKSFFPTSLLSIFGPGLNKPHPLSMMM